MYVETDLAGKNIHYYHISSVNKQSISCAAIIKSLSRLFLRICRGWITSDVGVSTGIESFWIRHRKTSFRRKQVKYPNSFQVGVHQA